MDRLRLGLDLGGTKIEGVALTNGQELARIRVDTPRGDYAGTIAALAGAVAVLEARAGGTGTVGVGIPGALEPESGLVKNANSVWLLGRPLGRDLEARLGRPVRVANDANCFAVSEATDGAGAGAQVVVGVILGTGTGTGIVVRGHLLTGPNAVAGEWGHNPLPWPDASEWPGPPCYCGRTGCVETFLSGPGLSLDHRLRTGRTETAQEIADAALRGDGPAGDTLARYEGRLARGLGALINVLDPDVIVLGGGLSRIDRLYERVPRLWHAHVFGCAHEGVRDGAPVRTRLVPARHGDASGVRGAAWLWPLD